MDVDSYILGESFTRFREEKGFTQAYLAHQLCCSKLQVQEIEVGGQTSFYSETQKLNTAKKMAQFLGMGDEQAFTGMPPSIDSKLHIHQYLGVDNHSIQKNNSATRLVGIGAVMLVLIGYGLWGTFSSEIYLFTDRWMKPKEVTSTVESEVLQRSEDNALSPESSLGQEISAQKVNEPNNLPSSPRNVLLNHQALFTATPGVNNTEHPVFDTQVPLPSAIKTSPKIDNTTSAE